MQALDSTQLLQINLWTLAIVVLLSCMAHREQWLARLLFGALTAALLVRYVAWRFADTLPDSRAGFATVWAYGFLFFELLGIAYTLFSIVVMCRRSDHRHAADAGEQRLRAMGAEAPAVDVFICTYNEGLEVLEKTIIAAQAMDYPNFTLWVLDDTRRDWLRDYCASMGVRYTRRDDNLHAKAGNLNNGLRQSAASTNAPYILVLDADFAPQRPILLRTLGLFQDPEVGLVQTPQFYYNPDPIQHNLGSANSWVDEQRVFFDVFQPAKDAWNAAFCVGTSFVVRRDLVERMGGFPTGAVCEDIYTSYRLMQMGYITRWLNERLSIGLSAEGLTEYINQRGRWCLGTIQVALLRQGPLFGRGCGLNDRLHYLHGLLHWCSKPFILMMLVSPVLYWYFGIAGFYATPAAFLAFGMPALIAYWGYSTWVTGRRSLPIFTEVTQIVCALAVTATLISAAIRPFGRPFKVTAKGLDRSQTQVHWKLFGFFLALSALAQVGAITAISTASRLDGNMVFNLSWTVLVLLYNLATLVACVDRPRLHGEERFPFARPTQLRLGTGTLGGQLVDISISGAAFEGAMAGEVPCGRRGQVWVDKVGWLGAEVVRRDGSQRLGLRFVAVHEAQRRALITRLFSQANPNVASTAQPATAFFTLLRRALLGEGDWRLRLVRRPRQAPIAGARVAVKRRSAQPAALQASSGPLGVLAQLRALMKSVW
ncbi:glycosyltransferase family 2 protein [Pseudomonas juntendi]|uniref:glycosyltransferase family 2 protein n=1 Tax=Pseudomonas juntendi TaxID=2666183 RepID=UPI001F469918|nr:glycosyltransferase family 2 protein [Pseudomonas juntendi]MCO7055280.1 glycosyltransferase [Pseudomonas juntendi]UJM10950.1 glycosyltransferase [Pseudomonas juntendi]UXA40531.1 glycosyltransferase [Pseudomonas juntendi]